MIRIQRLGEKAVEAGCAPLYVYHHVLNNVNFASGNVHFFATTRNRAFAVKKKHDVKAEGDETYTIIYFVRIVVRRGVISGSFSRVSWHRRPATLVFTDAPQMSCGKTNDGELLYYGVKRWL